MAGSISPEKKRLIDAIRRKNRKLTEASLKRFSLEDLQAMADTMGIAPGTPPPTPPSGEGEAIEMASSVPPGYMPCEYCDDLVKIDKYGEHLRKVHPDKLGLAEAPPATAGSGTTPRPVNPDDYKKDHWRDAKTDLEDLGYEVNRERRHSPDIPEDRLITVEITGNKAKLIVSDGPEPTPAVKAAEEAVSKAEEAKETAKEAEKKADEAKDKAAEAKGGIKLPSWLKGVVGTPDDFKRNIGG